MSENWKFLLLSKNKPQQNCRRVSSVDLLYITTGIQRPPKGSNESGLLQQVVFGWLVGV